ncbi:hypothetical protein IFM89_005824 [Coptis chinensis]|uniref:K+ potassium transporter integral membrane domain-containing protein n=1 Tax=Coptis chinensis TaxID=261450 RepID=A0A835GWK1_9MAGN|nr:hypothetical protein IFM89_005824 [Coptis chinensis]
MELIGKNTTFIFNYFGIIFFDILHNSLCERWSCFGSSVGPGRDLLFDGLLAFGKGSPNMNSLVGFGSILCISYKCGVIAKPRLGWDASFFDEPVMLLGFVLLGRSLEEKARLSASSDMNELLSLVSSQSRLVITSLKENLFPCIKKRALRFQFERKNWDLWVKYTMVLDYLTLAERVQSAIQNLREEFGEQRVVLRDVKEGKDVKALVAFAHDKLKHIDIWLTCLVLPNRYSSLMKPKSIWNVDDTLCSMLEHLLQLEPIDSKLDGRRYRVTKQFDLETKQQSLLFQSLGVVYGDLGTSPLYVFYNTFPYGVKDPEDIIGALSARVHTHTSTAEGRLNFCPLGACALAGTGLPIDRFMTSNALGFTAPVRNRGEMYYKKRVELMKPVEEFYRAYRALA